jgi:hypothetical protein
VSLIDCYVVQLTQVFMLRTPGRITYDLRPSRLHGLTERIPKTHRYRITPKGLCTAIFYTGLYNRSLPTGLGRHLATRDQSRTTIAKSIRAAETAVNSRYQRENFYWPGFIPSSGARSSRTSLWVNVPWTVGTAAGRAREPARIAGRAAPLARLHQHHLEYDAHCASRHPQREALEFALDGLALDCRGHARSQQGLSQTKSLQATSGPTSCACCSLRKGNSHAVAQNAKAA